MLVWLINLIIQFHNIISIVHVIFVGSQMIVTQLSNEAERTKDLARLGFSYGIGMVVGPSLGGLVTKHFG